MEGRAREGGVGGHSHMMSELRGKGIGQLLTKGRVVAGNIEIGKKAWLFAKLQPGRARKTINTT